MDDVNLYYFPGSYYSLNVILALLEKGIPYKGHIVNIHGGDQSHEWFLRLNPKGEVPVMKVGDTAYSESEHIIDVIDEMFKCGPKLVLEVDTRLGSEVRETRKLLHDLPIDVITFGVLANRKFQTSDNLPQALQSRFTRESIDTKFSATISEYRKQIQTCSPDVRTSVEGKLAKLEQRRTNILDDKVVARILDELEGIFDRIESILKLNAKGILTGQDDWLFGPEMTAADLALICLLIRLQMIGILSRYVNRTVRPELLRYFNRIDTRASILKLREIMASVKYVYMRRAIKKYGVMVLKIGTVVGIGYVCYLGYKALSKMEKVLAKN
ncbi:ganglioside-induced differentiation-associated protein 1-like [Dreissena polymorpha]|uniref:Ganglioside-induced differentiation-associated protein 1 n=1 Tax=Dreissena polymorpha TaxID=45954 RepID=A0A9D4EE35_DREPO|nr:ganglioside-induced differentiation-associated protein 1-like [Dreissena polymorpha]KAH3778899.1 hypothetical protein DPMN_180376 [Dreissena polymorpha]